MGDKGIFFITLSVICFWLVLDEFLGKKRISGVVGSLVGGGTTSAAAVDGYNTTEAEDVPDSTKKQQEDTGSIGGAIAGIGGTITNDKLDTKYNYEDGNSYGKF